LKKLAPAFPSVRVTAQHRLYVLAVVGVEIADDDGRERRHPII